MFFTVGGDAFDMSGHWILGPGLGMSACLAMGAVSDYVSFGSRGGECSCSFFSSHGLRSCTKRACY